MDAKDLRTESALSERKNDGSKYSQSGGIAIHCDRNKSYQDIGSNSLGKVDAQSTRPCAVIGPDRVVPPPAPSDAYLKKGSAEPWPCMDNAYHARRPPEYPHKLANFQNPSRNISPRQTFQENMQRIMVPPSYNSVKISDDTNYVQMSDRSNALPKNVKINVPPEAKFCDVPYNVYPNSNEQKNLRIPEMCIPSVNPTLSRTAPHGWPPGCVNIRPTRTYGAPELYSYQDYSSCAGPRPVVPRPNRTVPEESSYVYADPFYHQEGNIRFKPYPTVKDRFPQQRYEYIGSYPNSFHPPPAFPSHKYELQKAVPPHPYPPYPPIKYMDRVPEPVMEAYPRNQQGGYNIPYRNQIHPNYGPVVGNITQNKIHSYPPDGHIKNTPPNKLPFDNGKAYIEYENGRPKMYPPSESYLVNEMGKMHPMKSQVIMPNYPTLNMHNIPPNAYFKKDNQQMKNYEYIHFRNMDPNFNIHNPMVRHPPVFSPNTSAISPTDSSASNDTSQTLGTSQEDCGYVSQSSTASVRSMDSGINRLANDCFRKYYDSRFGSIVRTMPMMTKSELNSNNNSKEKKNLDVRQFLQMWNEGDEEADDNSSKDIIVQAGPKNDNTFNKPHEVNNTPNQEQLYVLGLVNVPSEELAKYEHIQKVSKLPENIKGYNHIELLNQFEEAIEFSNMANYKSSTPKDFQMPSKIVPTKQTTSIIPPRPLSPLDVEAKISQSVIHKEVGCNFEIKPCSPKMLNVEVATPVQNILAERSIEKVANPVMLKSPRINSIDDNIDCNIMKRKDHRMIINNEPVRIPSCKMVNAQFSNNNMDSIKNSYSLQDLESNSGLCLASLPRLDNDIELNFPEVNQQFINANKGESSVSLRDLPNLELLENPDSQNKDKLNELNSISQTSDVLKSPSIVDPDKEFSKLSKYRKSKQHQPDSKEIQTHQVLNAARTDSVIIKNPENSKNYEEKSIFSPNCSKKQIGDIQQSPINLTSQGSLTENTVVSSAIIIAHESVDEKDIPIEIAIDFSLHKSSCNENKEVFARHDKESEIFQSNNIQSIPPNHAVLDDNLSKLPMLSDSQENIQDILRDHNKASEDATSPIKYNECNAKPVADMSDDDFKQKPHKDISLKSECLPSLPCSKDTKDESKDMSSAVHLHDLNDVSSNSVLPIEFGLPVSGLLRETICDSNNYLMDIADNKELVKDNLDKADPSPIKDCLDNDTEKQSNVQKGVLNDDITEIIEDQDGCIETTIPKKSLDADLAGDALKDNDLYQETKSPVFEDTSCNNLDFTNNENFNSDKFEPDHTEERTVLSLNTIQTPSQDEDDNRGNDNEENEYNLRCNNAADHSTSGYCQSNIKQETVESEINTPLLTDIAILKLKDRQSDTVDHESMPNVISPTHNLELHSFKSEVHENDYDSPPIMQLYSPKPYQLDFTERRNDLASPINMAHSPKDGSKIESYSKTSVNVTESFSVTSDDLIGPLEQVHGESNKLNTVGESCHEETEDDQEMSETSSLKTEEDKSMKLGQRYLSFGSKEMYSPWIQKLVTYNEGCIKNANLNGNMEVNSKSELDSESEPEQTCDSNNLDPRLTEKCILDSSNSIGTSQTIVCNNSSEPDIQDNSDTIIPSDISVTEQYLNSDVNNINDNENKNIDNEEHNISESQKHHNEKEDASLSEDDKLISHIEYDENDPDVQNIDISTDNDVNKPCDNLDIDLNLEETETTRSLSPELNDQWNKQSNHISDTENEKLRKQCDNDEVFKSRDTQSYSNDRDLENNLQSDCADERPVLSTKSYENEMPEWEKQSNNYDVNVTKDLDGDANGNHEETWKKQISNNYEPTEEWDKLSNGNDEIIEEWEKKSNGNHEATNEWDKQSGCNDNITEERWDVQSDCSDKVSEKWNEETICEEEVMQWDKESNCSEDNPVLWNTDETPDQWDKKPCPNEEKTGNGDNKSISNVSSIIVENDENYFKVQSTEHDFLNKKPRSLKRSLSDSALNMYNDNDQQEKEENVQLIWPFKRRKINNIQNNILAQNLCNIIQSNRRNSISAIYNEENVSFCILIDNDCIIAEEENDDQDKICYTELSEDCLAEIQNGCTKEDEENEETEIIQQENDCEYSDSFVMQEEEADKLEESWVEDVACVETVISDDIGENIEICEPSSPKDDALSDNDESGVFSSSEHTDKVKYIYGDKMCSDDAQLVETLYNTPQMNVNKTLVQRETLISGGYYDNDSLEKILSESNEPELSPYVPDFTEPVYSPGIMAVKESIDDKENTDGEMNSPLQSSGSPIHCANEGIEKADENVELDPLFDRHHQDHTVHSCESSIDNVFTYRENDENTNYNTSSSPEVSSTTSEEKNTGILLKITNYQGSRISQINDINRDSKRPSCKFTEDNDYVQSHSNYSTHRPLLTKAAQKYIPPLKESMRDLKVKLSLPQHSLMKLKQLKISKDIPKCNPSNSVPRMSKKPKPKFEDVLKSIDEIQFKMHKEKTKKSKKCIPKVVIKKNENGSHYASTSNKEEFNPDLTGRKWQPWVFIEKNHFIDKMAIKKKTNAVYSHRKRTYVLAEKFQKYKSVNSAKFVISPPISDCPSAGLKYTIRLKHNY